MDRTINVQAKCKIHRVVFDRLGEVIDELKRLEPSDDIDDELMDNISFILAVATGLYNSDNNGGTKCTITLRELSETYYSLDYPINLNKNRKKLRFLIWFLVI